MKRLNILNLTLATSLETSLQLSVLALVLVAVNTITTNKEYSN